MTLTGTGTPIDMTQKETESAYPATILLRLTECLRFTNTTAQLTLFVLCTDMKVANAAKIKTTI